MKWKLIVVVLIALFVLSGCVLNEMFAITPRPDETPEELAARREAVRQRIETWTAIGMGLLAQFWPALAAIPLVWIGRGRQLKKQYQPQLNQGLRWYEIAVTLIKAVEKAKAVEVKQQVARVNDPELNRLVREVTD